MKTIRAVIIFSFLSAGCSTAEVKNANADSAERSENSFLNAARDSDRCIEIYKKRLAYALSTINSKMTSVEVVKSLVTNLPSEEKVIFNHIGRTVRSGVKTHSSSDIENLLIKSFSELNLCRFSDADLNYYYFIDRLNAGMMQAGLDTGSLFSSSIGEQSMRQTQANIAYRLVVD